ncbi:MAG: ABC transporter ATP-binding protein [Anaerolineaceae bacterium]|nr:ABC transporter ATP-binding protein [Anaerolineaceae bacterium]
MSALILENVGYTYKGSDRKAVNNVSARFEESKVNAVIGPSGSGKTTLLSIMAGLDNPTEGDALLDGEQLSKMDLDQYRREKVSMIFQAFHLFPLLTAIENVCFPMELNGVEKEEAVEQAKIYLKSVGITEEKYKRYPSNLSGGEQQRVAIARTLASGARVILADEPTGNLDKANGQNIVDILKILAHEHGYCVIIVTHDPAIAAQADQVWKMEDGNMAAD